MAEADRPEERNAVQKEVSPFRSGMSEDELRRLLFSGAPLVTRSNVRSSKKFLDINLKELRLPNYKHCKVLHDGIDLNKLSEEEKTKISTRRDELVKLLPYVFGMMESESHRVKGYSLLVQIAKEHLYYNTNDGVFHEIFPEKYEDHVNLTKKETPYADLFESLTAARDVSVLVPNNAIIPSGLERNFKSDFFDILKIGLCCSLFLRFKVKGYEGLTYLFISDDRRPAKLDSYFDHLYSNAVSHIIIKVPSTLIKSASLHMKTNIDLTSYMLDSVYALHMHGKVTNVTSLGAERILKASGVQVLENYGVPVISWTQKMMAHMQIDDPNLFMKNIYGESTKKAISRVTDYYVEYVNNENAIYHTVAKIVNSEFFKELGRENADYIAICYILMYYELGPEGRSRMKRYNIPKHCIPLVISVLAMHLFKEVKKEVPDSEANRPSTSLISSEFLDKSRNYPDQMSAINGARKYYAEGMKRAAVDPISNYVESTSDEPANTSAVTESPIVEEIDLGNI